MHHVVKLNLRDLEILSHLPTWASFILFIMQDFASDDCDVPPSPPSRYLALSGIFLVAMIESGCYWHLVGKDHSIL